MADSIDEGREEMTTDELMVLMFQQYREAPAEELMRKRDQFDGLFNAMINTAQIGVAMSPIGFQSVTGITLPLKEDDGSFFGY